MIIFSTGGTQIKLYEKLYSYITLLKATFHNVLNVISLNSFKLGNEFCFLAYSGYAKIMGMKSRTKTSTLRCSTSKFLPFTCSSQLFTDPLSNDLNGQSPDHGIRYFLKRQQNCHINTARFPSGPHHRRRFVGYISQVIIKSSCL